MKNKQEKTGKEKSQYLRSCHKAWRHDENRKYEDRSIGQGMMGPMEVYPGQNEDDSKTGHELGDKNELLGTTTVAQSQDLSLG